MANNLYLTLPPDRWAGPTLSPARGRLELQVVDAGEPVDGWIPVRGWRYDDDPAGVPAVGVWVAAEALEPGG